MSPPLPDQDEDASDPPAPTPSISSADGRPSSSETLIRLTAVHAPRGCLNTQIFNPHFRGQGTAYLMASTGHSLLASVGQGYPAVPAKRKRGGERVRVTRACDRCKKRKIKCNGEQPCDYCKRVKVSCTFDAAYSRGRRPSTSLPLAAGGSNSITVGNGIPDAGAHAAAVCHTSVTSPDYHAGPNSGFGGDAPSSQSSPEPAQTDLQGHYVGPTSGVSFLLRVQKRLHQAISFSDDGNIFTFGDAPLQVPTFDPSFCMMLPRDDAQHLVDRYFDFAMPTYRFLHRPTVQEWFDEFYDTLGIMCDTQNAPAKIALLFTVFALARVYMPENDRPGPPDLSTRYFLAADQQLTRERGSIRLTSVQVRLTQCCYLLTQSRINHCWSLFGTVSRLALALGLNRSRRADAASGSGIVESESRRRTFWCAYTLDAYLSVTLGRPRSFHDDDIDVEYPACIDDHELTADLVSTASSHKGFSTMLAPLAHIKLARIIGRIVRDLYSIKPISSSRRSLLTERVSKDLSDWRVELSRFLDADFSKAPLCIPLYQRQRNVLNFTYWHAIILTYRPFLLSNFARSSRRNSGGSASSENIDTEECVRQCLGAAMNTVKTIDEISETQKMYRAFWITAYFAFTATIVLYIYVIQKRASPPEVYSAYFAAATQCQSRISVMAEKGSLPERYCLVLEELRIEALRQARRMNPSLAALDGTDHSNVLGGFATVATSMPMNGGGDVNDVGNYADLLGDGTNIDFNNIPSSTMSDSPDWGHFASMVSSGLGNLDLFLEDDGFRF